MIAFSGRLGFFEHHRLVEDLRSLGGPIAEARRNGQKLQPPLALLERCGADILFASPLDIGARALQADLGFQQWLDKQEFGRAADGDVVLSWLATAIALGRGDLRPRFRTDSGVDLDAMLRWLVLHGIVEHGLFALAGPRFVRPLLRAGRRTRLAPLARLLLAERPDLNTLVHGGESGMPGGLRRWLTHDGAAEYRLQWCLPESWMGTGAPVPPEWSPPGVAPFLAPLPLAGAQPDFEGHASHLSFDEAGPLPGCLSDRAVARAPDGGVFVHATDLALRMPRPGSRTAVLMIRALPLPQAADSALLVALDGTRVLGAAWLTPRAGGTTALVLRDLPPGASLVLRLCRAERAPGGEDKPWARWRDIWLLAG